MHHALRLVLGLGVAGCLGCGGAEATPPPVDPHPRLALANCAVPPDIGDLVKNALGGFEGMLDVAHPRYFTILYCGVGSEISRSRDVRRGWQELDFRDWAEGPTFDDAVVRFAAARATYSLTVAVQHGHLRASPAKLAALDALRTGQDRNALPFVFGYALRVAGARGVDPDLRVALLRTLGQLAGKTVNEGAAYDDERFRGAVLGFEGELP